MPQSVTDASDYDALLEIAFGEFHDKQDRFRAEVADYPQWHLDNVASTISFFRDGHAPKVYAITPIGTWLPDQQDWAWGWANDTFSDAARERSSALQALETRTGDGRFGRRSFHAHADDVGELCALALHSLEAHAQFRTVDDLRCYYALQRT